MLEAFGQTELPNLKTENIGRANPLIEVRDLVKRYGSRSAVDHLSFTVEKGQVYGFLGPNGAGKSTTMNIMTGYLGATEGEVIINGHNILEEPEAAKKCIGYLPEQPPLYLDMTVDEYLQFAAELKGIAKSERAQQVERAVSMTHLEDVTGRLIKNLSKGYRQRVGLAQAVLGFPEILILDEPTVGLDPQQIIEIRDLIRELSEEHTIILSSHILSEVQEVCDQVLIIHHGRLLVSDSPENLEKHMRRAGAIEATVRGELYTVEQAVSSVDGIEHYDIAPAAGQDGCISLTIEAKEGFDVRESLFYACAEARTPIIMLKTTNFSLEEIFLELTQQADATPETDAVSADGTAEAADEPEQPTDESEGGAQ
ncbi:MAG TPA: ABC transporter ATP-binding protein [Candidatus Ventrousia excrementavium]|uniref:ABC transporter ATP-binding protein n=1 Tax=Candidatus Ventrousia excrementavium TaxID=2840961 RepID=A0A9D1LM25_9CLOT|nr:ABC transporter ATP-binding protein [Candidatus Ventrousia excrementavium]